MKVWGRSGISWNAGQRGNAEFWGRTLREAGWGPELLPQHTARVGTEIPLEAAGRFGRYSAAGLTARKCWGPFLRVFSTILRARQSVSGSTWLSLRGVARDRPCVPLFHFLASFLPCTKQPLKRVYFFLQSFDEFLSTIKLLPPYVATSLELLHFTTCVCAHD